MSEDDALEQGSDIWWQEFEKNLANCKVLIAMLTPSAKTSAQVKRELKSALERDIHIIPMLIEGDAPSSIPDEISTLEWIDVASKDKYEAGLNMMFEKILAAFDLNPTLNEQMIQHELHQITVQFPEVRWIRIIQVDGLVHPTHRFDAGNTRRDTDTDREEDRFGPMSAAALGLAERIASELVLGNARFMAIAGESATQFLLPIGDGAQWLISFLIKGHPPIDETIKYFKDRDYLANIYPFLET